VIHTPIRAPQANAYAERFVRTIRAECLDWLLILGRRRLERALRTYVAHYNRERPVGFVNSVVADFQEDPEALASGISAATSHSARTDESDSSG
jgi:transposase InsO family protein